MRTTRLFLLTVLSLLSTALAVAQDVIVNVTPVQQVLPPQALLYVSDPGKYFNITLTNTSTQAQNVYLALSVQQVTPSSGVSIVTPSKYVPKSPFTVPANGTKTLTTTEMKTMFNHIPANQIKTSPGLFDDYQNGSFGLLPEGDYDVQVTAYRWASPKLETPVVVSSPTGGKTHFTICYKAQAPQFLLPVKIGALASSNEVAEVDALNPLFTWTPPVITCNASANQYRYSLKIVEVLKNQNPTEAIEKNPVVYKAEKLTVAQCIIPTNIINSQFYTDRTYAAQITASSASSNVLNYVMIENNGKSTFRLFKIKTSDMKEEPKEEAKPEEKKEEEKKEEAKPEEKKEEEKKAEDEDMLLVFDGMGEGINADSLYTFSYPKIESPIFPENGGARKMFVGNGMKVEWIASSHLGGEGTHPDDIEIAYDVQLFKGDDFDLDGTLATEPVYSKRTTELEDSIPWVKIQDAVEKGNYMVLRVNPVVTKGESVAFGGEKHHVKDFALVELLTKKYFQCASMVDLTNKELTTKKAADYKGKTIPIGQYQLTIDEIKDTGKKGTFEGKGHVAWKPFGFEIGVCVKFSDLQINTDDIVVGGTAASYSKDATASNIDVVDKLFSDWGIDNLISDTGIPYASEISGVAKDKAKDLAKKIDLKKYYGYVKKGSAIVNTLMTGKVKDLYMPLSIPKSINKSPVDIQIAGMKFAATHATMDIIAEFTLPNTSYTKNDILVLGAPRICISPDRLLPEGGTIALLSDFTINDPKSSYELTFKAPKNVIEPENGCFVSWANDKFEMLGLDVDMKIPGLVKDKNGTATAEKPVFNAKTTISDWDDWMAELTIDPFQASALPGWTFTASNIVYDHSLYRNSKNMGAFPKDYNKSKGGITNVVTNSEGKNVSVTGNNSWQGLYIKEISIKFPKALEFGTSGDKRLSIAGQNMFFDKSGATLELTAANILSAKTGKAGGWSFSLDKVYLSFIQSNFSKCGFSGKFAVPLLKGEIGYDCTIRKMTSNTSNAGQYAYVFKTQQTSGLSLDFFLAKATFKKEHTYFLLESVPQTNGTMDTSCELMMGGDITLGGADYINKTLKKKLKLNFEIPGAHFCGMRISNKSDSWKSKYESTMQSNAKNASLKGTTLFKGKEMSFGSSCYFNPGKWSLASDQKKLGAFDLSLSSWEFSKTGNDVKLYLQGKVSLVSGIDISAKCGVEIYATAKIPTSFSDIKNISLTYKETKFKDLSIDLTFSGIGLKGTLKAADKDNTEGYEGTLAFTMPGDLFKVDAKGGYFKYGSGSSMYSYGWFYIKVGSKSGIDAPPVKINSISGGFYYNCKKKDDGATPQKGLIGVIAGLKMSTTAGEEALSAEVEMTVVYDSKKKRLSTFLFTGDVKAVSGLVSAKANLVYENNNSSRYLQLDITVDATADAEKLTNAMTNVNSSLGSLKQQLNSAYKKVAKIVPTGSLTAVNETQGTPDKSKGNSKGENLSASAGATISLQVKVTWRENGTTYSKPKWHLYLGEPDINKRCKYTLLKFKSKIVSIDIGANGYICLGNELPNNGKLPAIPSKVANFLNGSNSGKGIESASLSEANKARQGSLSDFESQITKIGGGAMFGAQVYGYLDVDLGIFYLNAGATAGFDISIVKLPSNATCVNLGGAPGYKGWYGYGQLYAYLYAKFGIRINLGFWKKDFDIADAGIGGLFQFQGPKPTHFEGKARVKLKLLGGLVNVDRRFSFECGQSCDIFLGNALDNFKLFGDLSIGYSDKDQGWSENNAINPDLVQRPYFTTEAPLEEPFRVLDETEKARLAKNYSGNKEELDMEASRTFIFRSNVGSYVTVKEYTSRYDKNPVTRYFYIKGRNRYANYLDIIKLNPNRYYEMTVSGYAKEIQKAKEVDPVKFNESTKKYYNEVWKQTKTYYFRTGSRKALEDNPSDFEDHIAIAFPSHYNKVREYGGYSDFAYVDDIKKPTIAFYSDVSKSFFQKGKLKWRLYKADGKTKVSERDAKWVVTTTPAYTCNLTVSSSFPGVISNNSYHICLEYETSKTVNGKVQTQIDKITDVYVYAVAGDWREGYYGKLLAYEKPFVGSSICKIEYSTKITQKCDYEIACGIAKYDNGKICKFNDPYTYIGYLANYAFLGGWQFTGDRMDVNITTSQSLIYTDKGGVYEGKLGTGSHVYNIWNDWAKIRDLSTYTYNQYKDIAEYPLPEMDDENYNYTLSGLPRVPQYYPSKKKARRVCGYIQDIYSPIGVAVYMCNAIKNQISWFDTNLNVALKGKSWTEDMNKAEEWYGNHRGQMFSQKFNGSQLQIPAYQYPIVWGSCLDNTGARSKVTAWTTLSGFSSADKKNSDSRGHSSHSLTIFSSLMGKENMGRTDGTFNRNGKNMASWDNIESHRQDMENFIKSMEFDCYRLNTYDINKCVYTYINNVGNITPYERFTIYYPLDYYNNYDK